MRTQSNLFAEYEDQQASGAIFSPCQTWRYRLERRWSRAGNTTALWIMLNPSTADVAQDDPTIRRCIGFSKSWGYHELIICNIFALRATNPVELESHEDPIGPMNNEYILRASGEADVIVAGWGAHRMAIERGDRVLELLSKPVMCLGVTRSGAPRHPLYVPKSQGLVNLT